MRRFWALAALIAGAVLALAPVGSAKPNDRKPHPVQPVTIQFLDISDWHAQLDPQGGVGGAAALSTYFQQDRAANPNTLTLTAGDDYGASPPLSSFFDEEPAVKALDLMGIQVDTFGNHNFDKGLPFLQNLIDLADFRYVSANLTNLDDNLSGVEPWTIVEVGGVKVGVVGFTNPDAPSLVFPGNLGTMDVTDPVPATMRAQAEARAAGADIVIAIGHIGVLGRDESGQAFGPLIDYAKSVHGFAAIFGDHTDFQFSDTINGQIVVENLSHGVSYSRTKLRVVPQGHDARVLWATNEFVTPTASAVEPDPAIVEMLAPYRDQLAAKFDEPIGKTTGVFERGGNVERVREVPIGDLVADSIRLRYGAQIAFTNGGGIRKPLPSDYVPRDTSLVRTGCAPATPCDLVVGDPLAVLPFGNQVLTRTVTGSQLWAILERSVGSLPAPFGGFLQISGFEFTFDSSKPAGSRVQSVTLDDGTPVLPDSTTYTAATNDFTNAGGDGYVELADGQGTTREVMADVLLDYIRSLGTIAPTTSGRITDVAS